MSVNFQKLCLVVKSYDKNFYPTSKVSVFGKLGSRHNYIFTGRFLDVTRVHRQSSYRWWKVFVDGTVTAHIARVAHAHAYNSDTKAYKHFTEGHNFFLTILALSCTSAVVDAQGAKKVGRRHYFSIICFFPQ